VKKTVLVVCVDKKHLSRITQLRIKAYRLSGYSVKFETLKDRQRKQQNIENTFVYIDEMIDRA
jgi:autonomous glycyl radical cofactor GrcA